MKSVQRLALVAGGLAVLAIVAFLGLRGGADRPAGPAGPPAATGALYAVVLEPQQAMPAIGEMKDWVLTLRRPDGTAVDGAAIAIDGGMPAHRHGLPTRPQVTADLGGGRYRVEGLKFSMGGRWELRFDISAAPGPETVTVVLDM
ncbi:MAG: FixH family protein [Rhizobiaceae bacterium]